MIDGDSFPEEAGASTKACALCKCHEFKGFNNLMRVAGYQ
jgi:hypothetical protein